MSEIDIYEGEDTTQSLEHVGTKHKSGRFREGTGERPYQHCWNFLARINELKSKGLSTKEISEALGYKSTTDFRVDESIAKQDIRGLRVDRAKTLHEKFGKGASEIAKIMSEEEGRPINESTVRSWLNAESAERSSRSRSTADHLIEELKTKHAIDVGSSANLELGVSKKVLDDALGRLEHEGYEVRNLRIPQPNNKGKFTTFKVLCDDTVAYRDLYEHPEIIREVGEYHSTDGGKRWDKREYPASISSDRVQIRYGDQGGAAKDGVIEIRPGVKDLDLGKSHYAQVRILVDDKYYLKGMAMYSDDLPNGVDIMFNTNKKSGTPKTGPDGVLKKIKDDPDNPFGAYIKADGQSWYIGDDGKQHLSAINKLKEEGDWDKSSKNLSSQFLSKQPMALINKQLDLTYADYAARYDEINRYSNPTVRRKLLYDFAGECDSAAVHMQAAALPRQQTRVILPVTQLKDNEVYAPYLKDGETVVLVRYPHGGTFEIPELRVNNKNPEVKKILGNATDAIGINANVAARLSGADFDGDTVVVIPTNSRVRIQTKKPLEELIDYDPKTEYGTTHKVEVGRDGKERDVYYNKYGKKVSIMNEGRAKQTAMGKISNLITDMTLRGAPDDEIALAVKHSMTVIDAPKHHLDYKGSYKDNRIEYLTNKWQLHYDDDGNLKSGGASTLISLRKRTVEIPETRGSGIINKETGEVSYKQNGRTYVDKTGKTVLATKEVPLVLQTKDVRSLSSGTPQENAYADFANKMKAMANQARKEYANSKGVQRSPEAAQKYAPQVASLSAKYNEAAKNQPRERRALALANSEIKAKIKQYPYLADKGNEKELAKISRIAMDDARLAVGAGSKTKFDITDKEWEAIQAGAISDTMLRGVLRYADQDRVNELAMPRTNTKLSNAQVTRINAMRNSGYTIAQMADAIGVSTSTISKYLRS